MESNQQIIYLAGPFCAPEEKFIMEMMTGVLARRSYDTYLSWRDGLEGSYLNGVLSDRPENEIEALGKASFALEMFQLVSRCCGLVLNMNGRVPDEGAIFKAAVVFAAGKPVVIYKRDHRTAFFGWDNSMVSGLTHTFAAVNRLNQLPRAMDKAMRKFQPAQCDSRFQLCAHRPEIRLGEALWDYLALYRKEGLKEIDDDFVKKIMNRVEADTV
jgi:nucleoside 2-deoxyribosyltransferase